MIVMVIQKSDLQSSFYYIYDAVNLDKARGEKIEDFICEMVPWLTDNFDECDDKRWFIRLRVSGLQNDFISIYLRDDEDAMAFKLKWCE